VNYNFLKHDVELRSLAQARVHVWNMTWSSAPLRKQEFMFLRKPILWIISHNSLILFTFGTLQNEKSQNYQRSFARLRTYICTNHGLLYFTGWNLSLMKQLKRTVCFLTNIFSLQKKLKYLWKRKIGKSLFIITI